MIWLNILTNKWVLLPLLAVALVGGSWVGGDIHGHHKQGTKDASSIAAANARYATLVANYRNATTTARALAEANQNVTVKANNAAADAYQRGLSDAQAKSDRVVADLRDGNLKLRREWAGCQATAGLPATASTPGKPDDTAERRAELAGAIVQVGAKYDAWIKALQAVVTADRAKGTP